MAAAEENNRKEDPVGALKTALNNALGGLTRLLSRSDTTLKSEMEEVEKGSSVNQAQTNAQDDQQQSDDSDQGDNTDQASNSSGVDANDGSGDK